MAKATVTGQKQLEKKLKKLATVSEKRIADSMLTAMNSEAVRGIRNVVPPKLRSVKKTVGSRKKKDKETGIHQSKAGFGVGKKKKNLKDRDPKRRGVGISQQNIHWFILGTEPRFTENVEYTGRMPKAPPWIQMGVAASRYKMFNAARRFGGRKLVEELKKL